MSVSVRGCRDKCLTPRPSCHKTSFATPASVYSLPITVSITNVVTGNEIMGDGPRYFPLPHPPVAEQEDGGEENWREGIESGGARRDVCAYRVRIMSR